MRRSPPVRTGLTTVTLAVVAMFVSAPAANPTVGLEPQGRAPAAGDLVRLSADYTRRYQDAFQFLIADETSEQRVQSDSAARGSFLERRVTRGELFVTYLTAERQWTVVHDVAEVDGVPVADREDIATWLRDDGVSAAARRIFALNARYNIGRVVRNFNDPMLALLPLGDERRSRFSFSIAGGDQVMSDASLVTLTFRERERPTIIRDPGGRPVFTRGDLMVDARTGVIHQSRLTLSHDGVDADLTTTFAFDPRMNLWLPSVFDERYASHREGRREVTTCESRYSNYRRFEVVGRLR